MRVLVTGTTGLVGLETAEQLYRDGVDVVGVSRQDVRADYETVKWDVAGDSAPQRLREGAWDAIVNCVADTRWTQSLDEAKRSNVDTVAALSPLVTCDTHVVHVSTAYAIGLRGSTESEDPHDYRNSYEWSKAAAERLGRNLFEHLTVIRPPLIMGRRGDGRAARFTGALYLGLWGISSGVTPVVVGAPEAFADVVAVDDVSNVARAAVHEAAPGGVLTVAGGGGALSVSTFFKTLTGALNRWREPRGHAPLDVPRIIAPDAWERFFLPLAREHLDAGQLRLLELTRHFRPYLSIAEALAPTHPVKCAEAGIEDSVRFWADAHAHLASQEPLPW